MIPKKEILFLILFFLSGCLTPRREMPATSIIRQGKAKKITEDVLVFLDLQQVDLNKDGEKEIVAVYTTGENSSGVKVIKFSQGKGDVVFNRIFNTKNTKFEIRKGVPTVISEELDASGRRLKRILKWNGITFAPK